jgi:hypothetical protein
MELAASTIVLGPDSHHGPLAAEIASTTTRLTTAEFPFWWCTPSRRPNSCPRGRSRTEPPRTLPDLWAELAFCGFLLLMSVGEPRLERRVHP